MLNGKLTSYLKNTFFSVPYQYANVSFTVLESHNS